MRSESMRRFFKLSSFLFCVALSLTGCMEWDYGDITEDFKISGPGLFICNEGNFQYGNATLSF